MADISKITLPSNDEYNIKDATARSGLATKQDILVSGTNIKTINNESLLGSGNITIQGGGDSLPDQTGHSGDILTTNGTAASWMDVSEASSVSIDTSISSSSTDNTIPSSKAVWDALSNVDALPDQTGHSGEFLTTDGTDASWATFRPIVTNSSSIATITNSVNHKIVKMTGGSSPIAYISGSNFVENDEFWILNCTGTTLNIAGASTKVYINGSNSDPALSLTHNYDIAYFKLDSIDNDKKYWVATINSATSVENLPSQTGNSGKFLTTNGTAASWANVPEEVYFCRSNTTLAQAVAAVNAGKMLVYYDSTIDVYAPLLRAWNQSIQFSAVSPNDFELYIFTLTSSGWSTEAISTKETFIAEYDVTPFENIKAAYDADKYIYLKYATLKGTGSSDDIQWSLCPLTQFYYEETSGSNYKGEAYFFIPQNNGPPVPSLSYKYAWVTINTSSSTDSSWNISGSSMTLITSSYASTTTPLMDGTASYGSGTSYARSDHVHPTDTSRQATITASGILKGNGSGSITAAVGGTDYLAPPSSPTSGNVLTYNGSAWVAQTPVSGLPAQSSSTNGQFLTSNGTSGAAWISITPTSIGAQPSGNYKTTQTAKTSPTASGTATAFIDSITQNANGEITATKKNINAVPVTASAGGGDAHSYIHNYYNGITLGIAIESESLYNTLVITPTSTTIQNVVTPTNNGDAANKQYVDDAVAGSGLPSQTGNSGKYLTTNGTAASWGAASATSTKSIDSSPTSASSNLVTSGGVYTAINNKVNRITAVNAADTNYTTLMARGVVMLDATTYDAVSDWSTYLVNGAIAWRYE